MRFLRSLGPSPAMVVAALALLVALAGTGVAAVSATLPRSSVGTAQLKSNAVVSSKVKNGSLLRADFKSGQIPAGPAGPAGAAATSLWAGVDATGTLIRNKGATSAQKLGTGDYLIIFNQDVTNCVYQATLGGPTTGLSPGQITAAQRVAVAAGVRVITQNSAGTPTDLPFYVSVFC